MIDKSKPIRLIELFAGIGSQAKALKNLGLDFEHYRICEFDKYAVQSYNAVHNTNFKTSDITKISASDLGIENTDKYNYLLTYSFPCQDLSNAGKGAGMEKGSGTRSGLLWEVERLLNECVELPQILLMENVSQVHGKKNKEHFDAWIEFLDSKGYSNFWQDLNAKDYGIPQNRKRCYMVSILGGGSFEFPKGIPLNITLKDVLDAEVEEKYYLSSSKLQMISNWKSFEKPLKKVNGQESISPTLTTRTSADCSSIITYSNELTETTDIEPIVSKSKLKETLCNELLDKGLVDEGDVIMHSYTNNRLNNGIDNMSRTQSKEKLSPVLTTRCDCLGVVVKESSPLQREVCDKVLENNLVEPYDIFDPTYANSRMKEIEENKLYRMNTTNNQIANTLTTKANNFAVCVPEVIGGVGEKKSNGGSQWYQQDRIYDDKIAIGVTPTATPYYATAIRGRYNEQGEIEQNVEISDREYSNAITTVQKDSLVLESLRIRKMTPKECWRLMGFFDEDFERAAQVCSSAQLYKQAGNSIVVNVLMAIFKELFKKEV